MAVERVIVIPFRTMLVYRARGVCAVIRMALSRTEVSVEYALAT
jgi:hypothetical protein